MSKAGENSNVPCVHCAADTMRVYSPVGIIFKGSGFYSTDYKNGSKNNGPAAPSAENTKKDDQAKKTDNQTKKMDSGEKSKPAEKIKSTK